MAVRKDDAGNRESNGATVGLAQVTHVAQLLVGRAIREGGHAVDATVGNGHDTIFLARSVGTSGRVDGFDVQAEALERTSARLAEVGPTAVVRLHLSGHEDMEAKIPARSHAKIDAVMFNLGYLPGGDHAVVTRPDSTLTALASASRLLRPGGILTVVAYLLHEGGRDETLAVRHWAEGLDRRMYDSVLYRVLSAESAPVLLAIEKRPAAAPTEDQTDG